MTGPSGDVSWIGSGGGDTAYPLSNHGTPAVNGGCATYATLSRSLGGNGGLGADGSGTASCTNPPTPALGGYGGGMGGGQSGGGGGVRIRSNSSITVTGQILAQGGHGGDSGGDPTCCQGGSGGGGSGGAIWLGAPVVYTTGTVSATGGRAGLGQSSRGGGGAPPGGAGGLGRIRLSSPRLSNLGILNPPLPPPGAPNGPGFAWVSTTYP
jgi:hypothetical protein